jgi:tetratricopeptide (TPR) repeat protein
MSGSNNLRPLQSLRDAERYQEALALAEVILTEDGESELLRMEVAYVHELLGDYARAISEVSHAITYSPNDPRLRLQRGRWMIALHRFEDAFKDLSVIIDSEGREAEYCQQLALAYRSYCSLRLGLAEQAIEDAKKSEMELPIGGAGGVIDTSEVIRAASLQIAARRSRRRR